MSTASEIMERLQASLARSALQARRLGHLLTVGFDERGRPAMLVSSYMRHGLAAALREAGDACEALGVEQGDLRWTAPVALIHHASGHVWTVRDGRTCLQIAALMERMRETVVTLRERRMSREIGVRLS